MSASGAQDRISVQFGERKELFPTGREGSQLETLMRRVFGLGNVDFYLTDADGVCQLPGPDLRGSFTLHRAQPMPPVLNTPPPVPAVPPNVLAPTGPGVPFPYPVPFPPVPGLIGPFPSPAFGAPAATVGRPPGFDGPFPGPAGLPVAPVASAASSSRASSPGPGPATAPSATVAPSVQGDTEVILHWERLPSNWPANTPRDVDLFPINPSGNSLYTKRMASNSSDHAIRCTNFYHLGFAHLITKHPRKDRPQQGFTYRCLGSFECEHSGCLKTERPATSKKKFAAQRNDPPRCDVHLTPMVYRECHVQVDCDKRTDTSSPDAILLTKRVRGGEHNHRVPPPVSADPASKEALKQRVLIAPKVSGHELTMGSDSAPPARELHAKFQHLGYTSKFRRDTLRKVAKTNDFTGLREWLAESKEQASFLAAGQSSLAASEGHIFLQLPWQREWLLEFGSEPLQGDQIEGWTENNQLDVMVFNGVHPKLMRVVPVAYCVMFGRSAVHYEAAFRHLFSGMRLDFDEKGELTWPGMTADFSDAQRVGYNKALTNALKERHPKITDEKAAAVAKACLRGCNVHFKRNVLRVSKLSSAVPPDQQQSFYNLCLSLTEIEEEAKFVEVSNQIINTYPAVARWLQWYLHHDRAHMIFPACRENDPKRWAALSPNTNATEAGHRHIQATCMVERPGLVQVVRHLYRYSTNIKSDINYEANSIRTRHGVKKSVSLSAKSKPAKRSKPTKKATSKSRPLGSREEKKRRQAKYKNDGRPPDTAQALGLNGSKSSRGRKAERLESDSETATSEAESPPETPAAKVHPKAKAKAKSKAKARAKAKAKAEAAADDVSSLDSDGEEEKLARESTGRPAKTEEPAGMDTADDSEGERKAEAVLRVGSKRKQPPVNTEEDDDCMIVFQPWPVARFRPIQLVGFMPNGKNLCWLASAICALGSCDAILDYAISCNVDPPNGSRLAVLYYLMRAFSEACSEAVKAKSRELFRQLRDNIVATLTAAYGVKTGNFESIERALLFLLPEAGEAQLSNIVLSEDPVGDVKCARTECVGPQTLTTSQIIWSKEPVKSMHQLLAFRHKHACRGCGVPCESVVRPYKLSHVLLLGTQQGVDAAFDYNKHIRMEVDTSQDKMVCEYQLSSIVMYNGSHYWTVVYEENAQDPTKPFARVCDSLKESAVREQWAQFVRRKATRRQVNVWVYSLVGKKSRAEVSDASESTDSEAPQPRPKKRPRNV